MAQYLDEGESVGTSKYRQGDRVLEASVHINGLEWPVLMMLGVWQQEDQRRQHSTQRTNGARKMRVWQGNPVCLTAPSHFGVDADG